MSRFEGGGGIVTVPPPYVGPGDIFPGAAAWGGFRPYSFATIGKKAVRLRRFGTTDQEDFCTTIDGLDINAITIWKQSFNLLVVTIYDQTGNGFDFTQATNANQMFFNLTTSQFGSGKATFEGSQSENRNAASAASDSFSGTAATISIVARAFGSGVKHVCGSVGGLSLGFRANANNQAFLNAGADLTADAVEGVAHSVTGVFANPASSSILSVDGASNVGNSGGTGGSTVYSVMNIAPSTSPFDGIMGEVGFWKSAASASQIAALAQNQRTFWGL